MTGFSFQREYLNQVNYIPNAQKVYLQYVCVSPTIIISTARKLVSEPLLKNDQNLCINQAAGGRRSDLDLKQNSCERVGFKSPLFCAEQRALNLSST